MRSAIWWFQRRKIAPRIRDPSLRPARGSSFVGDLALALGAQGLGASRAALRACRVDVGFLGFAGRDVGEMAAVRTGNNLDDDHADSPPTTQIVRLFHLSFDEGNELAGPKPFSLRCLAAVHRSAS